MCGALMFGVAANAAAGTAATTGLLGAGGAFSFGAALSSLSTVFSIMGQFSQAGDEEEMGEIRAQQERDRAEDAIQRGKTEEDNHRRQTAAFKGTQRSMLAANGVELDSGSASDLVADTAMLSELDALTIRNNAEREAYGYESNARAEEAEAGMRASRTRNDATGSALSFGGSVASKWYDSKSALVN